MNRLDPGMALGPSISSPKSSSKKIGGKRDNEVDLYARAELSPKRIEMQDLESGFRSEGIRTHHSDDEKTNEAMDHVYSSKGGETSQITDRPHSSISGGSSLHPGGSSLHLAGDAACLGHVGSSKSPTNTSGDAFLQKVDGDHDSNAKSSKGLRFNLNAVDVSDVVDHNPFHPYKKLGHVRSTDPSECGSTTGSLEESEPLRRWKMMKKNGFLSSSHGGIPLVPKQRGRQTRKRKEDEIKKKVDRAKREQVNRITKISAPSGLLSGLNPGIINHVRNSKQVHSIIEAIVKSEKLDGQIGRGNKEVKDRRTDRKHTHDSTASRFNLSSIRDSSSISECRGETSESDMLEERFCDEYVASHFTSGCEKDNLTLKLSSAGSMASENASCMSNKYFSASQESVSSLSLKAAAVASRWLELLNQDFRGRLAALRRSRKRVRNVIQTELSYLLSPELLSNQENNPFFQQSHNATSNKHVARWKSLFNHMDTALSDEGKQIECWLEQVKEMQLQCDKGLKSMSEDGLPPTGSSRDSRSKQGEALEREFAVRAAAASIYSTSDLIMKTDNVPCF